MAGHRLGIPEKFYHWVATPFALVAGPYYAHQLIASAIPFASSLLLSVGLEFKEATSTAVYSVLAAGIIGSVAVLYGTRLHQYRALLSRSLNPGIEILDQNLTYVVHEDSYETIRRFVIRPLFDGISQFRSRFSWSGLHNVEIIEQSGANAYLRAPETSSDDMFVFEFNELTRRKVTKEMMMRATLRDPDHLVRPFYAVTINHPILRSLQIRVIFDNTVIPKKCERKVYPSRQSIMPIHGEDRELEIKRSEGEGGGSVEWTIVKPRYGYKYLITWSR